MSLPIAEFFHLCRTAAFVVALHTREEEYMDVVKCYNRAELPGISKRLRIW